MKPALAILLVCTASFLKAQNKIIVFPLDSLPRDITYDKQVQDRSGVERQGVKIVNQLLRKGFLTASLDSIDYRRDTAFLRIHTGRIFRWGHVNYKNLPPQLVSQFAFNTTSKSLVNVESLKEAMTSTMTHFENRGYPFAYFYWDSLIIKNDTILGSLYFEKNILITFDTLALYGDAGVTKKFLYNYLGFKPGDPYNESLVSQLNDKLAKLPFTSIVSKPQLFFVERKAIVLLNLKKRRTDRLDGLIGFAPNTGIPGNTKLLVTGEFHLDFKNLKGSGKGFKADWQSFKARSQTLEMGVTLPYLLNQPIGAELSANLLKYDTLYTETRFGIGAQYIFSGLDNVKLFYEQKNTNLQSADTNSVRSERQLGQITSMKTSRYGLGLTTVTFDNRISPRKGYLADIDLSVFSRTIQKDDRINKVKFYDASAHSYYSVYDSVKMKSYQLMIQYHVAKPYQFAKRAVLYSEIRGFHLIAPSIYLNELYRFGGNSTFKGFNEQSLFASSVSIINMEVRYLLSEYSFLKIFGNAAYYMDKSNRLNKINRDIPVGFGAGINLETAGGIFNISVAMGKSKFNPIDFKTAKIHFGLINYF